MAGQEEVAKVAGGLFLGGITSYIIFNIILPKLKKKNIQDGYVNLNIDKDKAKVVHSFDIEDLPDSVSYCRCWRSSKFPFCDGTHNAHNKLTGDNVGPVCLKRKSN